MKVVGVIACLAVLMAFLTPAATPVYADDPYMDSSIPSAGMKDTDIEAMNKHEISWLLSQNQVLRDIYQMDSDFSDLIDAEIAKRGEATPLEIGQSDFRTAVAVAQSVHDQAAKIIGAQWGFNAKGKVTNRQNALQTVTDARYNLRDVHYRLVIATRDLRHAYADWRKLFVP